MRETLSVSLAKRKFVSKNNKRVNKKKRPASIKIAAFLCVDKKN